MSLSTKQWEFLQDVALLIQEAQRLGVKLTGGELYRTPYQQAKYVSEGKSLTLESKHLQRLAIDFNFFIEGELTYDYSNPLLKALGDYWESLNKNNRWGGNWETFRDTPHFERN